ncbi:MAG: tripartite tricarboxylate transporter TctB family protein [bacterium]|nr:tripartite tricarboxylate transporter TctB family protein [bacterium]
MRLHADTVIAALLIVLCAVAWGVTYALPPAPYGTMGPALFPRVILAFLIPLSVIYFVQGLLRDLRKEHEDTKAKNFSFGWVREYSNVIISFFLFSVFLVALPYTGFILTGTLFIFLMLWVLGPRGARQIPKYIAISAGVTGGLYLLFRFVLIVILPEGDLFD